ncbi:ECF transporter S component [Ureibacillus thermophilus]|uniref:ECF transporter S component n=1 Tax=Ureibacillus thermophilus TaxID=367743 RepID=A0A4P6UST2_9BACL|nr:ECF transporter S component [Ureibacillus thermophilus]QBK25066.1 ECF transporter S component [Ureibacillus thermophilus]
MKIREFTLTTVFLAIILLFALTPIGFIHLGVIKATIIHVPIIIASILLGPKIGAFLGLAFGISSVVTNTMAPTLLSFAFSPAIPVLGTSHGSMWALFVAIVPRVMVGVLPHYLYQWLQKVLRKEKMSLFLTGLFTTVFHTFFVMGSIALIFYDAYSKAVGADNMSGVILAILAVFFSNGIAEAILAAFAASLVVPPLWKVAKKYK